MAGGGKGRQGEEGRKAKVKNRRQATSCSATVVRSSLYAEYRVDQTPPRTRR